MRAKSRKVTKPTPTKSPPLKDGDKVWCVDFFKGAVRKATYISDEDDDCWSTYFPLSQRREAVSLLKDALRSELKGCRNSSLYHKGKARWYEVQVRRLQKKIKSLK